MAATYSAIESNPAAAAAPAPARDPDALTTFGGSILQPVDAALARMGECAQELNTEECSLYICGLFCFPCVIGEAIEQAGEGNFWVHCTAVLLAQQLAFVPFCCFTVPALNRISQRLGGEEQSIKHFAYLVFCRPCIACQLHRAVKEGRIQGRLGGSAAAEPNRGAPVSQEMSQ